MFLTNYLVAALIASASIINSDDGWVSVSRPERVAHQFEEDRSIWVVFAKTFASERVLLRFPEDPPYHRSEGKFEAVATHFGSGEFALLMCPKIGVLQEGEGSSLMNRRDVVYRDVEQGLWIRERHIETKQHHYILRFSHPTDSLSLFRQFADSFEIEQ